jgi:hypothetical protein
VPGLVAVTTYAEVGVARKNGKLQSHRTQQRMATTPPMFTFFLMNAHRIMYRVEIFQHYVRWKNGTRTT